MTEPGLNRRSFDANATQWWMDPSLDNVYVDPYEAMASIYDQIMSYVDYRKWFRFALEILTDHSREKKSPAATRILECGAGTGIISTMLALNGYKVDAFDKSERMIEIAQSRACDLIEPPDFFVSGFLDMKYTDEYHAALCLYDSVNYLLDPDDVVDFFKKIKNALKQDGLFLFDICTEINSRLYFNGRNEVKTGNHYQYRREMKYYANKGIQENLLRIRLSDQPEKIFIENHSQKIYTREEMLDFIDLSGMTLLEETDEFSRYPPGPDSLRIHFLCGR